jgi:hypothetical protein
MPYICFDCENIVDKTHLMADGETELCKECCYCNDD